MSYRVGDKVCLKLTLTEGPSGDSPGFTFATKGEILVVRRVNGDAATFPLSISHAHRLDNSFGVDYHEIELYKE